MAYISMTNASMWIINCVRKSGRCEKLSVHHFNQIMTMLGQCQGGEEVQNFPQINLRDLPVSMFSSVLDSGVFSGFIVSFGPHSQFFSMIMEQHFRRVRLL